MLTNVCFLGTHVSWVHPGVARMSTGLCQTHLSPKIQEYGMRKKKSTHTLTHTHTHTHGFYTRYLWLRRPTYEESKPLHTCTHPSMDWLASQYDTYLDLKFLFLFSPERKKSLYLEGYYASCQELRWLACENLVSTLPLTHVWSYFLVPSTQSWSGHGCINSLPKRTIRGW